MHDDIMARPPLGFKGTIPIFSETNSYTDNYEQIAGDHLAAIRAGVDNPFIPLDLWLQCEKSTLDLIARHSQPSDRILDVGVGLGRMLSQLPHAHKCGVDISLGYLEVAQSKGIEVCYSLIEELPYKDGVFDVVVCADVLEHVFDLTLCCRKILDTLRPGGVLIVRVPYRENLRDYTLPTSPYRYVHLRNFDEHSLWLLFERILECEVLAIDTAGDIAGVNNLKYPSPIPFLNRNFTGAVGLLMRLVGGSFLTRILRMLYHPVEINIVVRKPVRA